jgi:hypothetical protein
MFAGSAERSSSDSASEGFDGTAPMLTEIRGNEWPNSVY